MSKLHPAPRGLHVSQPAIISKVRQHHNCQHPIIPVNFKP
jgi:hypothetical protein